MNWLFCCLLRLVLWNACSTQAILQAPLMSSLAVKDLLDQNEGLIQLHKDLIDIESIVGDEHQVGRFLTDYLLAENFSVETQIVPSTADQNRPRINVFAYKGDIRDTRILVTSHMDTVTPYIPYELRNGNEIWGRGSNDAKGCVASQIIAVKELYDAQKITDGDVGLLFVVGEERDGSGMKKANELFPETSWEAVVFGEPSDSMLVLGHKGALIYEITAHGKAAHSSLPELGINANSMLIRGLLAIDEMELPGSEKHGNTTTNIGVMGGGVAMNIIPERASATILSRLAGGTPGDAMKIIERILKNVDERLTVTFGYRFGPVDCDVDIPGFETIMKGGGTDIPNLKGGHKRYLYGPGAVESAHSDHEFITVEDLVRGVADYKRIIQTLIAR